MGDRREANFPGSTFRDLRDAVRPDLPVGHPKVPAICPNVGVTEHHLRGAGLPEGGYLPLGTMCRMSDGSLVCFDCAEREP